MFSKGAKVYIKDVSAAYPVFIPWIISIFTLADMLSFFFSSLLCTYKAKQGLPSLVVLRLSSVSESSGGQVRPDWWAPPQALQDK